MSVSKAEQGSWFLSRFLKAGDLNWFLHVVSGIVPSFKEANNNLEKYFALIYPNFEDAVGLHGGFRFSLEVWRMKNIRYFPPLINKPSSRLKALQKLNDAFGTLT